MEDQRDPDATRGSLVESAPVGLLTLDVAGRVAQANPVAAELLRTPRAALLGVELHALVHDAAHGWRDCPFHRAVDGDGPLRGEELFHRPDGSTLAVGWNAGPLLRDGRGVGAVVVLDDISERADAAARDRFLAGLARDLQPLEDPDEVMATVARLVGEHLRCDRCAYAEAEADEDHFTMTGSYARGLPELVGRMAMSQFSAETLRCMRAGEPYVVGDAFTDPRILPEQRDIYRRTGITAVICVPLRKRGRFVAAMAVHHATPRVWTDAEVDLLSTVVARCWDSLQRAHALAAVRESEQRYRLLVERASDAIWLSDEHGRYVEVNEAACELLGYSREQLLQMSGEDLVRAPDRERLAALPGRLADGRALTEVWELRRADGSTVPVEVSTRSAGRGRRQSIGRDITARLRAEAERERLLDREREANRNLRVLQGATAALAMADTPDQVLEVILGQAGRLEPAGAVVVLGRGGAFDLLVERGSTGPLPAATAAEHPLAEAVRTGQPQWTTEPLALPLVVSDRAIGAVGLWFDDRPPPLTAERRAAVMSVAGQCAQALDRARLHEAEHEVADVLQRSLLPARLPALARLACAARYTPAAEHALSGGDWYDLIPVDGSRVALVVGDVVGHGPAAAAVMGQLRSALAAHLLDGHSPAAALERLDRFASRIAGAAGSTCACMVLDWSTGELTWSLAGHPPVLLVDDDSAYFLEGGDGAVLGVPGRAPYAEASATVPAGASAVLYTDGLVERRGETLDTGLDRLAHAAVRRAASDPDALVAGLVEAVLDAEGPADDVALLVVRAIPAPLSGRLPAAPTSMRALRREVAGWIAAAALAPDTAEDLELALGEAAANAAEHAYPEGGGEFEFAVARTDDGSVEARVRDHGRWRPVPEDNGYRGHGLRVIRELGQDVRVDRGEDGTEVRFRIPAAPVRPGAPAPRRPGRGRAGEPATVQEWPGGLIVLRGDVDFAGRETVAPALLRAAKGPGPLVVDLTAVRYLSSAGVALLAQTAATGVALSVVVAAGSAPARVLELTGLTGALAVTVRDAEGP
ncbi:SpoIIE family protein phosphatase [Pseudonocardia humida]|uniref:SpoIIE family protein phosphatase n=1 Tax=Pseudonocardia humida TaxID=2800819 RepID=A0ABT0ZSI4_9PSEU|nr:SpoIIE family protein phosphatase [Pseudonocardia humida]MCO1653672.1 SpoIIE family protein phosphatase [Pseudonocardia humida]